MILRAGFSIRTKLLFVALLLLLIPWMSYIYVRDMKTFLLSGQEDALSLTARAVATVLHDRPELFNEDSRIENSSSGENEIYAVPLPNYINVNGDLSDWGEQENQALLYNYQQLASDTDANTFSVNHTLGYHGNFIYALFKVRDNSVIYRQRGFLRVDAADHIRLTLQDPGRAPQRYTLIAREAGRMSIYLMDDNWQYPITGEPNYDLAAELAESDDGYNIELRIPRFMLSSDTRVGLEVVDVDNPESLAIEASIPTTPQSDNDDLSKLLVQSTEITKILQGLDRADTRIWVIDKDKQPRTVVGNIISEAAKNQIDRPTSSEKSFAYYFNLARYYFISMMQTIFSYIIDERAVSFDDHEQTVEQRNDEIIERALQGTISSDRRPSIDNQGTILMSAHPIFLGDSIPGAVVVEQSTNQILHRQQETLENVISITLLVLVTVATALLWFASRLTLRIRRLRNATDNAIDRDGRIVIQKLSAEAKSGDEIGDLSRSVSNMLERLAQYTGYLRGLPDTLAHELSNPLNVVNSSLHNMSLEIPDSADSKYMDRAKNGINRIGSILRNLTEAANLEQALQAETREMVNLNELIESYVDGYSFSNPDQKFEVVVESRPLMVKVAPDYIAQALDKLVDNAIDFAAPNTAIVFKARRLDDFAQIDVINQGSRLPEGMAERIFEPLVSLGRKDAQKVSLGMGLYVVKLIASFHGGDVIARNLLSSDGVIFSLSLPIHNSLALS
jgi:dedicated sortase system histidine kinase